MYKIPSTRIIDNGNGFSYVAPGTVNNFSIAIPGWAQNAKEIHGKCEFVLPGSGGERIIMLPTPSVQVANRSEYETFYSAWDGSSFINDIEGGYLCGRCVSGFTRIFSNWTFQMKQQWDSQCMGQWALNRADAQRGGGTSNARHNGTWALTTAMEFHTIITGQFLAGTTVQLTAVF